MYYPALEEVRRYAEGGKWVPVWREVVADLETPVSAFLKVHRDGPCFLLESVEGGQRLARYSFVGTEPYRVLTTRRGDGADPLGGLAGAMGEFRVARVPGLPRLCGGAVGFLSYEAAGRFERLPSPDGDTLGLPESSFMFVHTMLIYDHVTHTIKVLSHVKPGHDLERSYAEAVARIDDLASRLRQPLAVPESSGPAHVPQPVQSNFTREGFEKAVASARGLIGEGEAIQVVLSQRLSRPTCAAPFDIYRALRTINPSPYMFYLDFGGYQLVGASPEILVRVENGKVMTRPLAGTRRRGPTVEEDLALERELRTDEKERAEHIMLVDLGRNDIGRVSEPGSVVVSDLMNVERYSHVMHLVTHVEGTLRPDLTALDALKACFPAGTVSGAPKVRAMEIIAEAEPDRRGPYAGAVGYLSFSGNMDMAITIRTIVMSGGVAHAQAGCGIVYDSVPSSEFDETMNKARALLNAIDQAEQSHCVKEVALAATHR
ncbi:MAG: anthranilate synthase component I [Dehalococcoidia bacterium]|nr:anthranilate synthase component I [Dehalococcoidia bacterium]